MGSSGRRRCVCNKLFKLRKKILFCQTVTLWAGAESLLNLVCHGEKKLPVAWHSPCCATRMKELPQLQVPPSHIAQPLEMEVPAG